MVDFSPLQGRQTGSFIASANLAANSEIIIILQNDANCAGGAVCAVFSVIVFPLQAAARSQV